jgi:cell division protease FtsH
VPQSSPLLDAAGSAGPLRGADVAATRERTRRRRLWWVAAALTPVLCWLWFRLLTGNPVQGIALPAVDPLYLLSGGFFVVLLVVLVVSSLGAGRSPHIVVRPEQIDVGLADVVGIDVVKAEVVRTLNLFLAHRTFAQEMGGRTRRGVLLEGGPGTGKTHTAKALAKEAGVPFLMATATSFQSGLQGASQRKVRSFFRALRKAARQHGGAIGFIDEFDAIALRRPGTAMTAAPMAAGPVSAVPSLGCGGLTGLPATGPSVAATSVQSAYTGTGDGQMTVNELLVQLQSFDQPTGGQRVVGALVDAANLVLPAHRQLRGPAVRPANVLLLASTNTAERLDPALLRPGRFDQRLSFELPSRSGRRQVVDHFLARKAHEPELDDDERRDALAAITHGYSPAMIEGLLDEALVQAVQAGRGAMRWVDVEHARLVTEVGLGQPVEYTDHEARLIATHEAGHAVTAWLVAPDRRLEVLTIVKRRQALGLLAHGDAEEVHTRSRTELEGLLQIAFGGQVAEELFFGDVSTGPGGDLRYATSVAAQMVGESGMAGTLVSYAAIQGSSFADSGLVGRVLGDTQGRAMVEDLLQRQQAAVRTLLGGHRHLVAALRDALLEHRELVGSQITDVLEAARAGGGGCAAQPPAAGEPVVDLTGPRPHVR